MKPMMPPEGEKNLEDLAYDLSIKANMLSASLHPIVRHNIAKQVRSMNCYYSNLIEGHYTHPRDIDRALHADYEVQPEKRNLQLEARAHIEVQEMINQLPLDTPLVTESYIKWIHREFCSRLPDELLEVHNSTTGLSLKFRPGELRTSNVQIGRHIPPDAHNLPDYLRRFEEAYNPTKLGKLQSIIAIAASHHRLLWIHPFFDGNGRVARLFSHAFFKAINIENELWSVSRGLARSVQNYKRLLAEADLPRLNSLDGRGTLSLQGLIAFCTYFLKVCIDQVEFMGSLLELKSFMFRLEQLCELYIQRGLLLPGSLPVLRELFFVGELERGQLQNLTGYKERQTRTILTQLLSKGFVISDTKKGAVRLNFPFHAIESLFPSLYPTIFP